MFSVEKLVGYIAFATNIFELMLYKPNQLNQTVVSYQSMKMLIVSILFTEV